MPEMFTILYWLSFLATGGVADLGNDDFSVRESASARLEKWGIVAYPVLQDAAQSTDAEVAQRALIILNRLATPHYVQRCIRLYRAFCLLHVPESRMVNGEYRLDAWEEVEARDPAMREPLETVARSERCFDHWGTSWNPMSSELWKTPGMTVYWVNIARCQLPRFP